MSCNNPEGNRSCVTVLSLAELSSAIYILNSLVTSLNNRLLAYHIINEVTETNIDATTSSTIALPINLTRKPTIIFNLSDTKIYYSFNGAANITDKFYIDVGGYLPISINDKIYTGAVSVIHDGTGDKKLLIQEAV